MEKDNKEQKEPTTQSHHHHSHHKEPKKDTNVVHVCIWGFPCRIWALGFIHSQRLIGSWIYYLKYLSDPEMDFWKTLGVAHL